MLLLFINCFAQPGDRNKIISLYNDADSTKSISRNANEDSTLSGLIINAERPKRDTSTFVTSVRIPDPVVHTPIKLFTERGFKEIAAINSTGIIQDARRGELNIRGGRADEAGYYIDGVEINDPITGGLSTTLSPRSIIEVDIMKSDFGAQYGNAMSGIVNVITKSGMPNYFGSIEYVTDEFLGDGFKGLRSTGSSLWSLTLGGPIIPKNRNLLQFFGTFEYQFDRDPNPSYNSEKLRDIANSIWPKFREIEVNYIRQLQHKSLLEGDAIIEESKKLLLYEPSWNTSRPGQLPNGSQRRIGWNEKMTLNLDDIIFNFGGISSRTDGYIRQSSYALMNAFHNPFTLTNNDYYTFRVTWYPQLKTFVEGQVSYFRLYSEMMDPVHRDRIFDYGNPYKNPLFTNYSSLPLDLLHGLRIPMDGYLGIFAFPGRVYNGYSKRNTSFWQFNTNITHAIDNHHIKFGGEYKIYQLRQYSISPLALSVIPDSLQRIILTNPDLLDSAQQQYVFYNYTVREVDTYGYDFFGREVDSKDYNRIKRNEGPKEPIYGALFLEDRWELEGLIINAGLRWDYFDPNTKSLKNILDIFHTEINDESFEPTHPKSNVSPRLRIGFPVSDKIYVFANYGTFIKVPPMKLLYMGIDKIYSHPYEGLTYRIFSNPNLGFEKTKQFEIGINYTFSEYLICNLQTYYNEMSGQVGLRSIDTSIHIYQNSDISKSKGFEISIEVKRWKNFTGKINYTLSSAWGTASEALTYANILWINGRIPLYDFPLDFDQRHTISSNLNYRFCDIEDSFLKNFGINILFRANSGKPYTFSNPNRFPNDIGIEPLSSLNSNNTDWNYRFDLRIDKTFNLPLGLRLNTYLLCLNLFNHKEVVSVWPSSGNPDATGYLSTSSGREIIDNLILSGRESEVPVYTGLFSMFEMEQTNVGPPRQMRLGCIIEF
jgi:outer membrane receptor protein involved in Fe transport